MSNYPEKKYFFYRKLNTSWSLCHFFKCWVKSSFGELEGVKKYVILLFDVAFECKCLRKKKK